jgi:Flp pilus assembly pilin Flp
MRQFETFCRDDEGATAIEYSFIASLVAIAGFAALVNLGNVIDVMFEVISSGVNTAVSGASG